MRKRSVFTVLSLISALAPGASAHSRWVCPPPRDPGVGLKSYPCGGSPPSSSHSQPPFALSPGPNTLVFEEAVPHYAAPSRIALSLDGADAGFESCVLLDHIPHHEHGLPVMGVPATYTRSRITVVVPDVACARCTLQLTSMMTDGVHGVPAGSLCATRGPDTAAGAAAANASIPLCPTYHSCATVSIAGRAPRNQTACAAQPASWPYRDKTPSVYGSQDDTAQWSLGGWVRHLPLSDKSPASPLCS